MAFSKGYDIGDTVYVNYDISGSNNWDPVSRVVATIRATGTGNVATVTFSTGNQIVDSDASSTVYTTEAAAAAARVTEVISNSASVVATDTTTSIVSTAGNSSTTLGRIG
jgi:hypothetical protein